MQFKQTKAGHWLPIEPDAKKDKKKADKNVSGTIGSAIFESTQPETGLLGAGDGMTSYGGGADEDVDDV